jgi:hypothetical protein
MDKNIGQERLQALQNFGSYGEMIMKNSQGHPFQVFFKYR